MIAMMLGAVLLGSILDWYYDSNAPAGAWRDEIVEDNQRFTAMLNDPKTGPENKAFAQERLAINEYRLAHDIQPTSSTIWSGINGCAELFILITLFTVIVAGDSLASEFTTGTIKLLLIRPASRLKILVSKYVSMLIFGVLLLVILFLASVLVNGLLYKFQLMDLPLVDVDAAGQVVEKNMVANLWQTYLLNGVSTIIFVTMAFMISSAFRSSTMAIGFSIFALFAGTILTELLQRYNWSKFLVFPNLDLSQYLSGRPYQEGMTLSFSVTMLAIYFVVFNLIAWQVFTRRDVAA